MVRNQFLPHEDYAGLLINVSKRPIENFDKKLALIRLEFSIHRIDSEKKLLLCLGKVASRDLIVDCRTGDQQDPNVIRYLDALGAKQIRSVDDWCKLAQKHRWLRIRFGTIDDIDLRNPFESFDRFDANAWQVTWSEPLPEDFVTASVAADEFDVSVATIHRRVDALADCWGEQLLKRTRGNQRRINIRLLGDLWKN